MCFRQSVKIVGPRACHVRNRHNQFVFLVSSLQHLDEDFSFMARHKETGRRNPSASFQEGIDMRAVSRYVASGRALVELVGLFARQTQARQGRGQGLASGS